MCLPFNRSTPIAYYNRNVFRGLRAVAADDLGQLRATAARLVVRDGASTRRWGFECPIDWWFWAALVGQAGGDVVAPDGTPTLGGEAGVRALRFWQTLVYEDRTMKPPPGRDDNAWQVTNTDFLAGRVAMIWTSTAFLQATWRTTRARRGAGKFEVGAAPLPRDVRAWCPRAGRCS